MHILWLGLIAVIALVFLIAHCYLYRGLRITLTFFISCFLYGIFKENAIYYIEGVLSHAKPPYEVINPVLLIFHAPLVVCIGWLFALYTSWSLAEGILKKTKFFSGKLFPTLLLGGLIAASISYCVEATGIVIGWWRWTIIDTRLAGFLYGVTLSPLEGWFFTFLAVMVPYFLIECSKYRVKRWKYIFIIPTLVYIAIRISGNYMLAVIIKWLIFITVVCLAFRSQILLTNNFKKKYACYPAENSSGLSFMNKIPFFMILLMLTVMIFIDLKIIKRPELLISTLPIILFALIYAANDFLPAVFLVTFFVIILGGQKFLILSIPIVIYLAFAIISKFSAQRINNKV